MIIIFYSKLPSPKYPNSNRQVERRIETVKIKKIYVARIDPFIALLELHNIALYNNIYSPAQLLYKTHLNIIF